MDENEMKGIVKKVRCLNLRGDEIEEVVAVEETVKVHVNSRISKLRCSPSNLRELGAGHAVAESFLRHDEISGVEVRKAGFDGFDVFVLAGKIEKERDGREIGTVTDEMMFDVGEIIDLVDVLKNAKIWNLTAGTHSAILKCGRDVYFCEDVSRSCAVDKVIGMAVLDKLDRSDFENSVLAVSCRLSEIIVRKAVNSGIKILASKSAATSGGIKLAEDRGLTLIGFVRDGEGKVFSHPERLSFDKA